MDLSPYDEAEMVGLFTNIYKVFIRLGHILEEEVAWPPAGGHTLDTSLLDPNIIIDERVMSLMRHLPLPVAESPYEQFCDHMCAIDYRRPLLLASSRDVDKAGPRPPEGELYRPQQSNCRPIDMLLLDKMDAQCPRLVLSVDENVVRMANDSIDDDAYRRNLAAAQDAGLDGPEYLFYPAVHAPSYFKQKLDSLTTAVTIPNFCGGFIVRNEGSDTDFDELHRALTEDYRWPRADFRREEWLRDGPALTDALMERRARSIWPDAHGDSS